MAEATANPTTGPSPLTVVFDGPGPSDPDGNHLSYASDLDGDGAYDDSRATRPSYTYTTLDVVFGGQTGCVVRH